MVEFRLKFGLAYRYGRLVSAIFLCALVVYLWLTVSHLTSVVDRLSRENDRLSLLLQEVPSAVTLVPPLSLDAAGGAYHGSAELLTGRSYVTEMDMPRFHMFTSEWVYLMEPGLGKRVVERLFGSRREDLLQVIAAGDARVKAAQQQQQHGLSTGSVSFMFGIVRFLPRDGMHYELIYKEKKQQQQPTGGGVGEQTFMHRLTFIRPFGQLSLVVAAADTNKANDGDAMAPFSKPISTSSPMVHFVMTASMNRLPQLLKFFENHLVSLGKERINSLNFDVTVAMFLDALSGIDAVRDSIKTRLDQLGFPLNVHIVPVIGANFSRAYGLHSGIADVAKRNKADSSSSSSSPLLIFTTDVDVVVTPLFLNRCRLNAQPKVRIYYPIVYSLYNPKIAYPLFLNRTVPTSVRDLLNIHDETGWWRDFGYGMACFYKSDYDQIGGFGREYTHLHGWGYEDVGLFRKFIKSRLLVVRAVDPGVFHLYHKKECDAGNIGNARFRACVASRAYNEASHGQLGALCFKNNEDLV